MGAASGLALIAGIFAALKARGARRGGKAKAGKLVRRDFEEVEPLEFDEEDEAILEALDEFFSELAAELKFDE